MEKIQELYGFIITSKRRSDILKSLKSKPLRPFQIAKITDYKAPNVSRTLFDLEKMKLVECITPDKASWRVYAITELGKEVLDKVSKI